MPPYRWLADRDVVTDQAIQGVDDDGDDDDSPAAVDFCSGDVRSVGRSAEHRAEFLAELERHPGFALGTASSRLMDGNYAYIERAEAEIAAFYGAEAGLLVGSRFEANLAIWATVSKQGDVIIYDELVHASTHDGMRQALAVDRCASSSRPPATSSATTRAVFSLLSTRRIVSVS
ncbi:hypothetical protein F4808DRAFT_472955 [Astrocystis sublimbata]|nr:hypothetical protein F4808DRAFT_472955 [Astrocystis sublimbata]